MTVVYDAYGEDGDFTYVGGSVGSGFQVYGPSTSNNGYGGGGYRSAYARCGVGMYNNYGGSTSPFMTRMIPGGPVTSAWFGARIWCNNPQSTTANTPVWGLLDASGVRRLGMMSMASSGCGGPYEVYTQNAAGVQTALFTTRSGFSAAPGIPDKLDVQVNYASAGSITVYINGTAVGSFSGNLLTDSATAVAGVLHGSYNYAQSYAQTVWSECIVASSDTRSMSLQTFYPSGPGTEDDMTGAYTNVDSPTVNDANYDTTTVSGAIQRYTMSTGSNTSGSILAMVTAIRGVSGGSLGHIALAQKVNNSAENSASQPLPSAFGEVQFIQANNPATGLPFTFSTLGSAYEAGYEATT